MPRLKSILLGIGIIISVQTISHAQPYTATFAIKPYESHIPPYSPGIGMRVSFGKIISVCDYPWYCWPPPPYFAVTIDWQSPNQPNCYIPVFGAFFSGWGFDMIYLGRGTGGLRGPFPRNMCCYWPLHCGYNQFDIIAGPLVSGLYRVRLFSVNWSLWNPGWIYCDENKPNWMWNRYSWHQSAQCFIKINSPIIDYSDFMRIFYVDEVTKDTIYSDRTLDVLGKYSLHCKIRTSRRNEDMPGEIWGEFRPQDVTNTTPVRLVRAPAEDEVQPCDPSYPLRIYGYKTPIIYKPMDFWDIDPEEWSQLSKQLQCVIWGAPLHIDYDGSINELVLSDLTLTAVNDTTFGFIPLKGEVADFIFNYSNSIGLNPSCHVNFNVQDKMDRIVYSVPVYITAPIRDPDDTDLPDLPILNSIPLYWDGTVNHPLPQGNHFADPDIGPYRAYVTVDVGSGMQTNVDTFSVIPMIDSVLLTNSPSFPPPVQFHPDTIFSVIKAKIDDSPNTLYNYRYYIPPAEPGEHNPGELNFWINARDTLYYHFWDLDGGENKKLYFENNFVKNILLNIWDRDQFGELRYAWKVIHDKRDGLYTVNYSEIVDTSDYWGRSWYAVVYPLYWSWINENAYMRLLTVSEVENNKNGYLLQADTSASGRDAHKVMLCHNTWVPNMDIVDWAVTHIGTPYAIHDGTTKLPYEKIDCAGFVTATKIQEIWECSNPGLSIGPIYSYLYYNGYYGNLHMTDRIERPADDNDFRSLSGRTFLLFAHRQNDNSFEWRDTRHIMIIYFAEYDPETNRPRICSIINSAGGRRGKVRFDNAFNRVNPIYNSRTNPNPFIWTVLKWRF